ncbi:hypothetical protein EON66_10770 [archaeon]|nr:MAG: hypothetical protein EON66_10770 [archaeon]
MAAPPSPLKPAVPVPATLLMLPLSSTRRMRWLLVSAMNSTTPPVTELYHADTPFGYSSCAAVAGPPSPLKPGVPVPATLLMMPLSSTRRMQPLNVSAMYSTMPPLLTLYHADTRRG